MSDKEVTPSAMAKYLEKHNQRFAAMSKNARRVKIEQNHTWRIRLLPVEMGPEKEPFVDIAQHWWNKAPITCPKHTSEAWGGDPEYPCPVCELSSRLQESSAEDINGIGYRVRCNLRVRSWCVVFDMEDHRGNVDDMPISEILNPYEFDMYKTTWESFAKYQKWALSGRRGGKEPSVWGILDLETGCDLLATQGAKGVVLDRSDPGPIFPLNDPNYDTYLQKIWNRLHKPQIVLPTEKQLLEIALKVEEYAEGGGSSGRRRGRNEEDDRGRGRFDRGGRSRSRDDNDSEESNRGSSRRSRFGEDQDDDTPPTQSRRAQPAAQEEEAPPPRRRAVEPEAQEEAPAPPSRRSQTRAVEPEPSRPQDETPAPPPRRSSGAGQARQTSAQNEDTDQNQDESPDPAPPPPARRGGTPAAPPSARRTQAPADEDGDVAPQKPPTRRAAAPPPSGGVDDEEDNAPEEKRDPAPPVREPVDETPPPVSASGPAPKRTVGSSTDIKARLDRLNAKGR